MGVGEDPELFDSISVTVIATGFNVDQQNEISNTEPEKIVHDLEGDNLFSHVSEINELNENSIEEVDIENNDKIVHVLEEELEEETQNESSLEEEFENKPDLTNEEVEDSEEAEKE